MIVWVNLLVCTCILSLVTTRILLILDFPGLQLVIIFTGVTVSLFLLYALVDSCVSCNLLQAFPWALSWSGPMDKSPVLWYPLVNKTEPRAKRLSFLFFFFFLFSVHRMQVSRWQSDFLTVYLSIGDVIILVTSRWLYILLQLCVLHERCFFLFFFFFLSSCVTVTTETSGTFTFNLFKMTVTWTAREREKKMK